MGELIKINEGRMLKRGEIYKMDLPLEDNGCVQKGTRPCVIVQNDKGNRFSPNIVVLPITSRQKTVLPTHVTLVGVLPKESTILCEQIITISKMRVREYLGTVEQDTMNEVNDALLCELGLN